MPVHGIPSSCASTATTCSSLHCSMSVSNSTMRLFLNIPYMYAYSARVLETEALAHGEEMHPPHVQQLN